MEEKDHQQESDLDRNLSIFRNLSAYKNLHPEESTPRRRSGRVSQYMIVTEDGDNVGRVEIFTENVSNHDWDLHAVWDVDSGDILRFLIHPIDVKALIESKKEKRHD